MVPSLEPSQVPLPLSARHAATTEAASTTFTPNQKAPVHRWFRYSAGFSGEWARRTIEDELDADPSGTVLDPFAGVATTLVAARLAKRPSVGLEAHAFVHRVARAKLAFSADVDRFRTGVRSVIEAATNPAPAVGASDDAPPALLAKIFTPETLLSLRRLEAGVGAVGEATDANTCDLLWLCLVAILRSCSGAGTAPWQYVLPNRKKAKVLDPLEAYLAQASMMASDMAAALAQQSAPAPAELHRGDARSMTPVDDGSIALVLTSPPYPNNYDYADATRIELTFLGEVERWRDLHAHTRRHLMVSCSQHARSDALDLDTLLADDGVEPIRGELVDVCRQLESLRHTRKGKKHYDTMVAAYFRDMSRMLGQSARVLRPGGRACLVIGDSAPYGVHVPADRWLAELGRSYGLDFDGFEQTRVRNVKWKNRKHRVPLKEGRLWMTRSEERC